MNRLLIEEVLDIGGEEEDEKRFGECRDAPEENEKWWNEDRFPLHEQGDEGDGNDE